MFTYFKVGDLITDHWDKLYVVIEELRNRDGNQYALVVHSVVGNKQEQRFSVDFESVSNEKE